MEKNLKTVFNNEYSENRLTDFLIKTQKAYELFGYEFDLKPTEIDSTKRDFYGAKVWLNEDYVNSAISNLKIISFNLVYPTLIAKLAETNLKNFNEIYSKLIEIYNSDLDIHNSNPLKSYINMAYGCLQNPESMIYSKNIYLVPTRLNNLLSNILIEFKGHIVYIDTRDIYFRNFDEIKERFEKYFNKINKYDLTYSTQQSKFGLFMAKKQYVIEEDNNIKIKGMKHFNSDGVSRGGLIEM